MSANQNAAQLILVSRPIRRRLSKGWPPSQRLESIEASVVDRGFLRSFMGHCGFQQRRGRPAASGGARQDGETKRRSHDEEQRTATMLGGK
jgi:hypothetical protein